MAKYADHWTEAAATEAENKPPTRTTVGVFNDQNITAVAAGNTPEEKDRAARHVGRHVGGQDHADVLEMLGLAQYTSAREDPYHDPDRELVCATCQESRKVGEFARVKKNATGLANNCRDCANTKRRERERGTDAA